MRLALLTALLACRPTDAPGLSNLDQTHPTQHKAFMVTARALRPPVVMDRLHTWTLTVTDPQMRPVTDARITVEGGMPAHGHGLPTAPRVSAQATPGDYAVEGLRFNMPGDWIVTFRISAGEVHDDISVRLSLP